jgi:hypothetical protein
MNRCLSMSCDVMTVISYDFGHDDSGNSLVVCLFASLFCYWFRRLFVLCSKFNFYFLFSKWYIVEYIDNLPKTAKNY